MNALGWYVWEKKTGHMQLSPLFPSLLDISLYVDL